MSRKTRVGILTFSDQRRFIHEGLIALNQRYQDRVVRALEATGEVEVVAGEEIVWRPDVARREGRRLSAERVDVTILNYAIWAFPHLSAIASEAAPGPFLLFSNLNASEPGMVAMLAAAGTMDQLGRRYSRVWGDIEEAAVLRRVMTFVRAAGAVSRLRGETFGLFGGRPLGMYTAVANLDQWQSFFGVDVEHVEQYDLVRYGEQVAQEPVSAARAWLEKRVGRIAYDGKALTPEKLELQIRSYYAARRIIDERDLDFVGFKAQGDLTDYHVTMDVAEAFLNDPYDWDGPHEPIVAATEADMDGALTMQIFKHMSAQPVLFSDVRHYEREDDIWYLANSGMHPTFFAARSKDPEENLKSVTFFPEVWYYPAGGASVQHFAAAGEMTLARLFRKEGRYRLALVPAELVEFPESVAVAKAKTTTPEWPHAFARLREAPEQFLSSYPCNHIHGVYGDWTNEWLAVAEILGIEVDLHGG
ncbi:MAG TPA: L-fucose/L-arabinose isomerase family protein [Candidatus Baltobacterales bacterium]|nr:L-fucose/L-arabinose isomerase family protein [Candidatus Baltobacterales bacterium]